MPPKDEELLFGRNGSQHENSAIVIFAVVLRSRLYIVTMLFLGSRWITFALGALSHEGGIDFLVKAGEGILELHACLPIMHCSVRGPKALAVRI